MPKFESAKYGYHSVKIMKDSILYGILQTEEIKVNSYHHQAVRNIAEGYKVAALSKDGIIEAIESVNHSFIVGVQWHPEILFEKYPVFLKIFSTLVNAASR
jgi:putative glutamine amidotransferase